MTIGDLVRKVLVGGAVAGAAAAVPFLGGCTKKSHDNPPAVTAPTAPPTYISPVLFPGISVSEADHLEESKHAFISKANFYAVFLNQIGNLPGQSGKGSFKTHVESNINPWLNDKSSIPGVGTIVGYSPDRSADNPSGSLGGIWGIVNLNTPTSPFTDRYNATGTGTDTTADAAVLFKDSGTIDQMVRDFFITDVKQLSHPTGSNTYSYTKGEVTDVFYKYAGIKNNTAFLTVSSGSVSINSVSFDADAYVQWTDTQGNTRKLAVRIDHPSGNVLSNVERAAIKTLENGRKNGTAYSEDVMYINLSDTNNGANNSLLIDPANNAAANPIKSNWGWNDTSTGGIRQAVLTMLDSMYK